MQEINFQDRFHELQFQYEEYLKRKKNIANSKIGKYQLSLQINNGQYGTIFQGKDTTNNMEVAAKILDLKEIEQIQSTKMKQIRRRLSESQAKLMMICQSDNLVKCYDVYQNQSLRIIFMQYCNGKNLQLQIEQRGRIPQQQAISIMRQIMLGLYQMHRHKIIHRDLKGCNIVSHNGIYKICDFGFAKEMKEGLVYTCLGTVSNMALEVLLQKPYGIKADIWSLGVIFFQMVFGKLPYSSRNALSMIDELQKNSIKFKQKQFMFNNYTASTSVTSFLRQILVVNSQNRLDDFSLLNHPIFHQAIKKNLSLSVPNLSNSQQAASLVYLGSQIDELFSNITEIQPDKTNAVQVKYRINIQQQQSNLQNWIQSSFLSLSKTQLIFYEVVQKLIQNNLLDIASRDVIQMIFLIITRGLNDLTSIKEKAKLKKREQLQNLLENVQTLYTKLYTRHQQYSKILTRQQDKIISIIYDRILKVFSSESIIKKDIFLSGIEQYDYTKQQQIQYTYNQYIEILLQNFTPHQSLQSSRVKGYLKYYIQIAKITLQEYQQSHLAFKDYIHKKIFK